MKVGDSGIASNCQQLKANPLKDLLSRNREKLLLTLTSNTKNTSGLSNWDNTSTFNDTFNNN